MTALLEPATDTSIYSSLHINMRDSGPSLFIQNDNFGKWLGITYWIYSYTYTYEKHLNMYTKKQ